MKSIRGAIAVVENKEDILIKTSEVPKMLFDALDELSNHSHHRKENAQLIKMLVIK